MAESVINTALLDKKAQQAPDLDTDSDPDIGDFCRLAEIPRACQKFCALRVYSADSRERMASCASSTMSTRGLLKAKLSACWGALVQENRPDCASSPAWSSRAAAPSNILENPYRGGRRAWRWCFKPSRCFRGSLCCKTLKPDLKRLALARANAAGARWPPSI